MSTAGTQSPSAELVGDETEVNQGSVTHYDADEPGMMYNEEPLDGSSAIELPTPQSPFFRLTDPIKVMVLNEDAVVPSRAHDSDTGLDVTPISVVRKLRNDTWLLGTGIAVKPPIGFYIDMVGRSSISKSDVIVANAFGVIDEQYRGELMIAVTPKVGVDLNTFDPESLITGKPLVQIILRPLVVADAVVVDELDATDRGEGGFGHTDAKR